MCCRVAVQFARGAFEPLVAVTPVALHYPATHLEMATTAATNAVTFFIRCMCQVGGMIVASPSLCFAVGGNLFRCWWLCGYGSVCVTVSVAQSWCAVDVCKSS